MSHYSLNVPHNLIRPRLPYQMSGISRISPQLYCAVSIPQSFSHPHKMKPGFLVRVHYTKNSFAGNAKLLPHEKNLEI